MLKPTDPEAFIDYPLKEHPGPGYGEICPKCQGHGGWNLILNTYPLRGKKDTPENRHLFSHFRTSCGACWGWGYLREEQTCAHEWGDERTVERCLHEWICAKCGATTKVDSSD
jgi:hypothetical protein